MDTHTKSENDLKTLLKNIPLSAHLNVEIYKTEGKQIVLSAPLENNVNYAGTAFGGSIYSVSVLSCYLMLRNFLQNQNINFTSLVIQTGHIEYLKPITERFIASCSLVNENNFLNILLKKKKARISLSSIVSHENQTEPKAQFDGVFVVQI